jgi:hypothetical protein
MLEIKLNGIAGAGKFAKVDHEDYNLLINHSWHYKDGYALAKINNKEVRMHRYILQITDPQMVVDHINRDRLDNRRKNLRPYSLIENANNRSNNVYVEAFGEEKTIAEWSRDERCCVSYDVLRRRIYDGIPAWAAILAPVDA